MISRRRGVQVCVLLLAGLFVSSVSVAERYKRPMTINKVKRIGLEIWTEMEPLWKTELMMNGKTPVFVAHTPGNVYPPAGMMWVNNEVVQIKDDAEFKTVAYSTLLTIARSYLLDKKALSNFSINPASYGKLKGFEASFSGKLEGKLVDVRGFTGRVAGTGPITMQVYTSYGKINHLSGQIRRSWSHTSYLHN